MLRSYRIIPSRQNSPTAWRTWGCARRWRTFGRYISLFPSSERRTQHTIICLRCCMGLGVIRRARSCPRGSMKATARAAELLYQYIERTSSPICGRCSCVSCSAFTPSCSRRSASSSMWAVRSAACRCPSSATRARLWCGTRRRRLTWQSIK